MTQLITSPLTSHLYSSVLYTQSTVLQNRSSDWSKYEDCLLYFEWFDHLVYSIH